MITIHENNKTEFNSLGLGALLPGSCVVTEELNGLFELQLTHSRDEGGKWKRIERGRILYASTPKGKQPFRIYNIRPTMDGITVNARHIFYDLLDNQCEALSFTGTAEEALEAMENAFAFSMPFWFTTDISISGTLKTGRMNPIQVLLTSDEDMSGFVQTYGGELERDGFHVSIKAAIGKDRDVAIRYGKNLVGLEVNEDDSDVKTRIVCYGKNGSVEAVDSPYIGQYPYPKIHTLEDTSKTIAELKTEAEALFDSGIDIPLVNIKVDFVELTKTAEYADYAPLEKVELGDIVTVVNQKMNFSKRARVISYEWDCLLEKYKEVVLGDFVPTLATSVTSGVHSGTLAGNAMGSAAAAMAALESHIADKNNPHQTTVEGLPGVTTADDGKVLTAEGGVWVPKKLEGAGGENGKDGVTFTPSVSETGDISWTNDGGLKNPVTVNIMGPAGKDGADGQDGKNGADGYTPVKDVDYFDGKNGTDGVDGKTAYEYAQDGGYTGTEEEFALKLAEEKDHMVISCIIPAGRSTGDINGDGDITEADIQLIKDHNSGTTPITDETAVRCAVMNTNGKVDPGTIAGYNLYATGEAEYSYYTGPFINSVTVESVSLEDVLGNWEFQMFSRLTTGGTLLPDVIGEESKVRGGDFYIDIPIDGVTETSDVCLMFGKQPEYYNFRAKAYDGYVRIATVAPPVEEVSCTIVHKLNGNGNIGVYYPGTILEEKDPTVPEWAKQPQKPGYTADEVGALPVDTSIPTKVSELENDKNYLTEHQSLDAYSKTTDMLKMVYPVGAVYISAVATNPQTLFGFGTWEQIKDRFLLSAGDTYKAGNTGGKVNHNHEYGLKVYEYYKATGFNPSGTMTGVINIDDGSMGEWTGGSTMTGTETMNKGVEASAATTSVNPYHFESRANTSTEDNMPPYLTVYMWKRTA